MAVDLDIDQTAENSLDPDKTVENDSVDLDQIAENGKQCRSWSDWEWEIV